MCSMYTVCMLLLLAVYLPPSYMLYIGILLYVDAVCIVVFVYIHAVCIDKMIICIHK